MFDQVTMMVMGWMSGGVDAIAPYVYMLQENYRWMKGLGLIIVWWVILHV